MIWSNLVKSTNRQIWSNRLIVKSGQMKAGFYNLGKQNSWKYETRTRFNSGHMHNLPASEDWLSINAKDRMTISNSLPQDPPGVTNNFPRIQTFLSLIRVQWSGPITQLGGCASVPDQELDSVASSYASLKTLSQILAHQRKYYQHERDLAGQESICRPVS